MPPAAMPRHVMLPRVMLPHATLRRVMPLPVMPPHAMLRHKLAIRFFNLTRGDLRRSPLFVPARHRVKKNYP